MRKSKDRNSQYFISRRWEIKSDNGFSMINYNIYRFLKFAQIGKNKLLFMKIRMYFLCTVLILIENHHERYLKNTKRDLNDTTEIKGYPNINLSLLKFSCSYFRRGTQSLFIFWLTLRFSHHKSLSELKLDNSQKYSKWNWQSDSENQFYTAMIAAQSLNRTRINMCHLITPKI